jgi:hypothetical protein
MVRMRSVSLGDDGATFGAPDDFNRLARPTCDECGSSVEWMTGAEAEARGVDLAGGMEFLGVTDIPGEDVWLCTKCDNYGIMGSPESDIF